MLRQERSPATMQLRRLFLTALSLAPSAVAFAPLASPRWSAPSKTRLHVGLHDQRKPIGLSEDELQREKTYAAVLKEVLGARVYLDWIIDEQQTAAGEGNATETPGDATVSPIAAGGEVELFGGGGGGAAPAENFPSETSYRTALRADLGATILLSGMAAPDAALLSILNNNLFGQAAVPNFQFSSIRALVSDATSAKKRLLGREARYSGLLDKLSVEESSSGGGLPSAEELKGATSWITEVAAAEAGDVLPRIAGLAAESADLKHLSVMVTGVDGDAVEGWDAVVAAAGTGSFSCTLLAAGALDDGTEGGFVHVGALGQDFGTGNLTASAAAAARTLPRKRAYPLLALSLALDSTAGAALAAYAYPAAVTEAASAPYAEGEFAEYAEEMAEGEGEGEKKEGMTFDPEATRGPALEDELKDVKMEGRLVRAIREAGLTPLMELDVLARGGVASFKDFVDNPPEPKETEWSKKKTKQDEEDKRIMAQLDALVAKDKAAEEAELHKEKEIEVAGIAQEWAIREYALRKRSGELDTAVTEEEFILLSKEEALAEAEKTYARIKSPEYIKEQEAAAAKIDANESKLFPEGMSDRERKKREMIVERVKKQYVDMLSDEEMEQIIFSEI